MIQEAVIFHLEGMVEDGDVIPKPTSSAIEVEAPMVIPSTEQESQDA